jgi:mono/diheme cytochrome c family protein
LNFACKRTLVVGAILSALVLATPMWGQPGPQHSGQQLFSDSCAGCHNKNGDGKTNYAKKIPVPDLRSKDIQGKPDEELYALIARGSRHVNYPHAFELRGMSRENVLTLIQYIRTMK